MNVPQRLSSHHPTEDPELTSKDPQIEYIPDLEP